MKKLILIILAVVVFISASSVLALEDNPRIKFIVYYFHGSFRCHTCTNMEKYSKEAVEANFKDALVLGKLEFKAVNVDERENEHFVKDYKLYTKALIISLVKGNKEVKYKNLDKIWQLAGDRQRFVDYVGGQIREFMEGAQ